METEVERLERELREAGWKPLKNRGRERKYYWVDPQDGHVYLGPYGAWQRMQSRKEWGS